MFKFSKWLYELGQNNERKQIVALIRGYAHYPGDSPHGKTGEDFRRWELWKREYDVCIMLADRIEGIPRVPDFADLFAATNEVNSKKGDE